MSWSHCTARGTFRALAIRSRVNLLIREFVEGRRRPTSAWTRARGRRRRALYISSPIGLGHARYPRVRDRAVFVGDPDDIVPERFGPDLPAIRDWTELLVYDESPPDAIAAAIASELGREVDYRPVPSDGAARAAKLIAEAL